VSGLSGVHTTDNDGVFSQEEKEEKRIKVVFHGQQLLKKITGITMSPGPPAQGLSIYKNDA